MRALIDYRPALRRRTGVGEYTHELAVAVAQQLEPPDHLVLFSSSWKDRLDPSVMPGVGTIDARVPVRALNLAWHRLGWPPIERFAGPVDVAHAMHPLLLPARRAAQIVTIYDLYFLDRPGDTRAEIRRDYPRLAAAHARRADAVVVISEYTAALVHSRFGVPRARIAVCTPGAPAWEPVPERPAGGPLLFVGTIEPRKNVDLLLRAYGRLLAMMPAAPPLLLAGAISPSSAHLLDAIARAPLAGRVRHLGYVEEPERRRLYREAAVLVVPSLDEGFGMTALEAMTVGLPVIATNRGALPEVVGEAGVLVDAGDDLGMATALHRLLTSTAHARHLAAAGIARAKRFSWRTSGRVLLDTYRLAMETRAGRHR